MTPRSPAGNVRRRRAVVAGRGDDDHVVVPGVVDRRLEGARVAGIAEAHVDDVGAVLDRPHDAFDDVAVLAEAVGAEDGDRHHADARVADAGDARAVVGRGGDDPGHPRAVAVGVGRSPAEPSSIEVPATSWPARSGVRGVDAGVEHGDDRASRRARRCRNAVVQPIVLERPLVRGARVVGHAPRRRGRGRASTLATLGSARRSATTDEPAGTAMAYMPSGAIESTTSAPAAARALDRVDERRAGDEGDDVRRRRARRGGRGGARIGAGLDRRLGGRVGRRRRPSRRGRSGRARRRVGGARAQPWGQEQPSGRVQPSGPARGSRWDRGRPWDRGRRRVRFGRRGGLCRGRRRLGVGGVGGRRRGSARTATPEQEQRLDEHQHAERTRLGLRRRAGHRKSLAFRARPPARRNDDRTRQAARGQPRPRSRDQVPGREEERR